MRKDLQKAEGVRAKFTGTFARFGMKNGYKGPLRTVLLTNITSADGHVVTDHLWFNLTKGFEQLDLHEGDRVEFVARVKQYQKGYLGYREDVYKPVETDYKLSHPTKARKLYRQPDERIILGEDHAAGDSDGSCLMKSSLLNLTYEIEIQPGEKLVLPKSLVESVGEGRWLITIQSADSAAPIRDHSAFLSSYAPEDEGLYDDYPHSAG